ncbi:Uncharacterised protein [Bordetella pertussis]|nr:Uncharacterised protein [Bordetella pertussis]
MPIVSKPWRACRATEAVLALSPTTASIWRHPPAAQRSISAASSLPPMPWPACPART